MERLNLVFIVFAFGLSVLLPFELFLLVYAILGPAHYLTEINWLREKNYFSNIPYLAPALLVLSLAIAAPNVFLLEAVENYSGISKQDIIHFIGAEVYTSLYYAVIALIIFGGIKKKKHKIIALIVLMLAAIILSRHEGYELLLAILLPTIIHVYVFTLLFMLYGYRKIQIYWAYLISYSFLLYRL